MISQFSKAPSLDGETELNAHIYLPHMVHFGTDFAGKLFYFHPAFVAPSGEMPVIFRGQSGEIVKTYENFIELLRATLARLKRQLQ